MDGKTARKIGKMRRVVSAVDKLSLDDGNYCLKRMNLLKKTNMYYKMASLQSLASAHPEKFPTKFPCTLGDWRESRDVPPWFGTKQENF